MSTATTNLTPQQLRLGLLRWGIKQVVFTLLLGVALFVSAGTSAWQAGLLTFAIVAALQVINGVILLVRSPELLVERAQMKANVYRWDIPLAVTMAYGSHLVAVVAGLDFRFAWSTPLGGGALLAGVILMLAGNLLTMWAMLVNQFFSGLVRIQTERGHRVADGGPYGWVRHPGYAGMLLFVVGFPLALEQSWALLPAALVVSVTFLRTSREDAVLQANLPGYAEFARRVRYRLLPFIW